MPVLFHLSKRLTGSIFIPTDVSDPLTAIITAARFSERKHNEKTPALLHGRFNILCYPSYSSFCTRYTCFAFVQPDLHSSLYDIMIAMMPAATAAAIPMIAVSILYPSLFADLCFVVFLFSVCMIPRKVRIFNRQYILRM